MLFLAIALGSITGSLITRFWIKHYSKPETCGTFIFDIDTPSLEDAITLKISKDIMKKTPSKYITFNFEIKSRDNNGI